jgi:hypothetical protein
MDKTQRGELLVEKENVERAIAKARAKLRKIGEGYSQFGSTLMGKPETIGFFKDGYSVRSESSGSTFRQSVACDVNEMGDIDGVVKEVVALQDALDALTKTQQLLMIN